jgi:hypothetical protein
MDQNRLNVTLGSEIAQSLQPWPQKTGAAKAFVLDHPVIGYAVAAEPAWFSTGDGLVNGTKIECRILPSTCRDKCPLPVVSSTKITSPTPITPRTGSMA